MHSPLYQLVGWGHGRDTPLEVSLPWGGGVRSFNITRYGIGACPEDTRLSRIKAFQSKKPKKRYFSNNSRHNADIFSMKSIFSLVLGAPKFCPPPPGILGHAPAVSFNPS